MDVYFSLGANMGDREDHLETAVLMMADAFACRPRRVSKTIETKSWGFEGADFLNNCVLFRLTRPRDLTPEEHALRILEQVKRIERILGRAEEGITRNEKGEREYHDRPIDIDILFYGKEKIKTEALTIPHPLIAERDFVKIPLNEIATETLKRDFSTTLEMTKSGCSK